MERVCNESFLSFSDGSLAVATSVDCKYTKIQSPSQVWGFDLSIVKLVRMIFMTAFIELHRQQL